MGARVALPDDVWLLVFGHASVRDLCMLGATSHSVRTLVLRSRSTWSDVVQDLLFVSPSLAIAHAAPSAPAAELRAFALRYARVHAHLCDPRSARRPMACLQLDDHSGVLAFRLLPGLPYLVSVMRDGAVCLMCTSTASVVGECAWTATDDFDAREADLLVAPCKRSSLGLCVVVTWSSDHGLLCDRYRRAICVYSITGSAAAPRLSAVTHRLIEEPGSSGFLTQDLLLYTRSHDGDAQTLVITTLPHMPMLTHAYPLPPHIVLGLRVVGSTICASTATTTRALAQYLYRLPDVAHPTPPAGTMLAPYATFDTPGYRYGDSRTHHSVSPLRDLSARDDPSPGYLISICGTLYRVRAPPGDPDQLVCVPVASHLEGWLDHIEALALRGLRICTATKGATPELCSRDPDETQAQGNAELAAASGPDSDESEVNPPGSPLERTVIHFHPTPITAEQAEVVSRRLGTPPLQHLAVQWPALLPPEVTESDVEFDEWTGLGAIAFSDSQDSDPSLRSYLSSWSVL